MSALEKWTFICHNILLVLTPEKKELHEEFGRPMFVLHEISIRFETRDSRSHLLFCQAKNTSVNMLSANINFLCKHFSLVLPKTHYTANSFSTFKDRFVSMKLKNQENTDAIPKFWICKLRKYILLLLSWKGVCGFIFLQSIALFSTCLKFVDHAEKPKN